MSFEPSALVADQRYIRLTCGMEPGLATRLKACLDPEEDLAALRALALEMLPALTEECGGGTSLIMVSRFAMGEPICEVRYDEPGNRDGLVAAVWLLLAGSAGEDEAATPKQTTFIRHGPDESAMGRALYRWSGGSAPAPLPLLDTHVHFYDPSRPGGVPWPPRENALLYRTVMPDHLTELAAGWGCAGCIAVECSGIVEDNAKLLTIAAAHSLTVRGVVGGGIEIGSKTFAEDLDKFVEHPLFVGIRVRALPFLESIEHLEAGPKEGDYFADLEHLAVNELAVDVIGPAADTGTVVGHRGLFSPKELRTLAHCAKRLPTLRILVNHTAGVPVNGEPPDPEWLRAMEKLADCPNVWIKLSVRNPHLILTSSSPKPHSPHVILTSSRSSQSSPHPHLL